MTLSEYLESLDADDRDPAEHVQTLLGTFEQNGWKPYYENADAITSEILNTAERYRHEPLSTDPFIFTQRYQENENQAFLEVTIPDTAVDRLLTARLFQEGPTPAYRGIAQAEHYNTPRYFAVDDHEDTIVIVTPDPTHVDEYGPAALDEDLHRISELVALNDLYVADPRNEDPAAMERNNGYKWMVSEWYKEAPKWEAFDQRRST